MAQNYNDTIHKMQTSFEMRAGLPKKEPKMLEDWEQNHVYEQMIKNNEGKPQYIPARRPSVCQRQYPHGYGPEQDHQGHHHPL